MIKNAEWENLNGPPETHIKENIKMMNEMVKVKCFGQTEVAMLENGTVESKMAMERWHFPMALSRKAISNQTFTSEACLQKYLSKLNQLE